jgi:hypothetical protein
VSERSHSFAPVRCRNRLEQGFTLNAGPTGGGALPLALALSGNLTVSLEPDTQAVSFARSGLHYAGLTAGSSR